MTVASPLPSLNAFIAATKAPARFPASATTADAATGRPSGPWHMAQPDASARTPETERFGAANAGGASCALAPAPAARRAIETTPDARRVFMRGVRRSCASTRRLGRLDGLGRLLRRLRDVELHLPALVEIDGHAPAVGELAEEELVGERAADRVLDEARHRARAHLRVEAVLQIG